MTSEGDAPPTSADTPSREHHRRALFALGWSSAGTVAMALANALAVVVLSRLVAPEAFGVFAAGTAIGLFLKAVGPTSITQATLRVGEHPGVLKAGTTVAWVSAVALSAVLVAVAGPLGDLLHMGDGAWVLRAWSAVLLCQALAVPAQVVLQRDLRFKELTVVQALSTTIGTAVIPIALAAALGMGLGALFAGVLAQAVLELLGLVRAAGRLELPGRGHGYDREVARASVSFSALSAVGAASVQGDNLVVAATLGDEALGYYSRAYRLMSLPANMLGDAIDTVLFPVILKSRDDLGSVASGIRLASRLLSLTILPLSALSVVLGQEIVDVLLGRQWEAAGPVLQILAVGMYFRLGPKPLTAALRGLGRQNWLTGAVSAYAAGIVLAAVVGGQWGLKAVATGVVAVLGGYFVTVVVLTARAIGRPARELFAASATGLPSALAGAGLALLATVALGDATELVRLVVGGVVGLVPVVAAFAFPGPRGTVRTLLRMRKG